MKVTEKHASKEEQKAKIRRRYQGVDPGLIECIPGKRKSIFMIMTHISVWQCTSAYRSTTSADLPMRCCRRHTYECHKSVVAAVSTNRFLGCPPEGCHPPGLFSESHIQKSVTYQQESPFVDKRLFVGIVPSP